MKPGLANAMLLLLLPLSRQSQAKIDRQTEEQKIGAFRSLSFVVCLARSPFHIIHPSLFHPFRTLSPRSRCSTRHTSRHSTPTRRPRKRPPGLRRWRTRLPRSTSARSGCTNSSRSPTPTEAEGATAEEGRGPPRFTWDAAGTTEGEEAEEVRSSWVTLRHHRRCADWKMSRSRNHGKPAGPSS